MARIRHLAVACDHPGKAADFFVRTFGFRIVRTQGLDGDPEIAPRPSAVGITDGEFNLTFLKLSNDQIGVGADYVGLHHFGIEIEGDMDAETVRLEGLGIPCLTGPNDIPPGAHKEYKFRGPDGVVFDITDRPWPGTEAESESEIAAP